MELSEYRVPECCARCLYDKQEHRSGDAEYLRRVREIISERRPGDCAPYLVCLFNRVYAEMFGAVKSYAEERKSYNDLMLSMEESFRSRINAAPDPLAAAFCYARTANYIDFGAMNTVEPAVLMSLFEKSDMSGDDLKTYASFVSRCEKAESFLLVCDNSGEIVLDKLFLETLQRRFPQMKLYALVRGGEALNDAMREDAVHVGLDKLADITDNGLPVAGTIYELMSAEARACLDGADVVLAKGQGNYESMHGLKRKIFYSFLCKCELFTDRFSVPRLTGLFLEEG